MNERSSNNAGCSIINGISNASEITNMIKAFRNRSNVFRKSEIAIKDDHGRNNSLKVGGTSDTRSFPSLALPSFPPLPSVPYPFPSLPSSGGPGVTPGKFF